MDQPALDEAGLRRVGRLTRDLHDASAGFSPPPGARWNVVIPPDRADLVCHHDLAPWNLVTGARTGTQPWARLHAEGHGEHWAAAADYIERNLPAWRRALR
jgi:Ser/Thr protein kinase RdoA (MazF antagonist)